MEAGNITFEELLNFNFIEEEEEDNNNNNKENYHFTPTPDFHQGLALPEFAEEDLEWLSNKEAFPSLESCLDILSETPNSIVLNHHSPVSVLDSINISNTNNIKNENNNNKNWFGSHTTFPIRYPMKPRSNSRQRRRLSRFPDPPTQHFVRKCQVGAVAQKKKLSDLEAIGKKCTHCQVDKTPQWRAGPMGPKTLCNACGVRYKSGRLVPEYRPANSPTFSSVLHSNSHRKVVEMRKKKELWGVVVKEPCANSRVT